MDEITPSQQTGKSIEVHGERFFSDEDSAQSFFTLMKKRLQDVNQWHKLSGEFLAIFHLHDSSGNPVEREPIEGDHFQIDVPGPGTNAGQGYDWVRVEVIESTSSDDFEEFGFLVRPARQPGTTNDRVAHFYSSESTSTFLVSRHDKKVSVNIYDRNIKPNTSGQKPLDKVRDVLAGTVGILGFSKLQWQRLADGLLADHLIATC